MIEIPCITQHQFAIWHLLSLSEMNKVIERGCCAVTWVIERLIIIYVEKWADLIRLLKSEESTESKGSNLSCGGQTYGLSQAFRSDWNSTGTFVTNLEMQRQVLDSASVRHFLGKSTADPGMQVWCNAHSSSCCASSEGCSGSPKHFQQNQQVSPEMMETGRRGSRQNDLRVSPRHTTLWDKGETGAL